MRFLTTLYPARRLEYFGVLVVLQIVYYCLIRFVLQLEVDLSAPNAQSDPLGAISYSEPGLPIFFLGWALTLYLDVINVGRRLKDLRFGFRWILLLFIPAIGTIFSLYLVLAKGIDRKTYTPYGDDPYDPNSWVPPSTTTSGTAVTYQGQEVYLPGEQVMNGPDHQQAA